MFHLSGCTFYRPHRVRTNPTLRGPVALTKVTKELGLHDVKVTAVEVGRVRVQGLEAIDGTPIVDLKPALSPDIAHR